MALKVQNTQSIGVRYDHWFFHGLSRAGKTVGAATFPHPFFIVPKLEGSHISLRGRDIDFVEVNSRDDMEEALGILETGYHRAKKALKSGEGDAGYFEHFPWETVVVESVTHYCDAVVEELSRHGQVEMDWNKWGKLAAHLRAIQARLRKLPVHVVFVALSRKDTNAKGETLSVEPNFPGQMQQKLPSACENVVYFERRNGNPRDRFIAHFKRPKKEPALVGCRYDELTEVGSMEPFNFRKVEQLLGRAE